jgi:uncharacterized protein
MNMKLKLTIVTSVLLIQTNLIEAAGFDCAKAANTVENLICNNENLSQLDDKNTALFREYKSTSTDEGQALQDQRDWLKHTRNACLDASCLEAIYQNRNSYLESRLEGNNALRVNSHDTEPSPIAEPPTPSQVDLPAEVSSIVSSTEIKELTSNEAEALEHPTQPQILESTQSTDNAVSGSANSTVNVIKLKTFSALHAQEISGIMIFILLISGFILPAIMRKIHSHN